ncbi:MAG TPA: hypothetical protein VFT45_05345 [Longimicrobium sp.]|nr:hypothetical protein [Longimicrobium sp.]
MAFKMGVLLIHGMGNQERGFAAPMIDELKARVRKAGGDDHQIAFQEVWWAPVLADKEETLLRNMADGNDLEWMQLRRFVMHSLADAIAYQDTNRGPSTDQINVYHQVHNKIAEAMKTLRERVRAGADADAPDAPLVVIAHSLGCHMISNYIWDVRDSTNAKPPANPFEGFQTLTGIVMFGCNIPVFTLAYVKLDPIAFPTPNLKAYFPKGTAVKDIEAACKWLNLYDPDDVLGYPLAPLMNGFDKAVTDVAVDAGPVLRSWNPLSHTEYWTDNDVTRPTAEVIHKILKLL